MNLTAIRTKLKNPYVSLGLVALLIIAIIVTIYAVQKQQEIRQRAAEAPACTVAQALCSWDAVPDVQSYRVKITNKNTGAVIEDISVTNATRQVAFPATAGVSYQCDVRAVAYCGTMGPAGTATTLCPANTGTPTPTLTPTKTPTPTVTPTGTLTPTPTGTLTPTPTRTPTPTPTGTPVPTPTFTPTPTIPGITPTPTQVVIVITNTPTSVIPATATPVPTLAPTGPKENIAVFGGVALGVVLVGAAIFFIL